MKTLYKLSIENRNQQYVQFELLIPVSKEETEVCLPTWRPGRYELGKFAKNVRLFQVLGEGNEILEFQKTSHSVWKVQTGGQTQIKVRYQYFASELNGGASFLNHEQLYLNPVNCFMYTEETKDLECEVELQIPEDYQIACSLEQEGNKLKADCFDTLADAPFIASANMEHGDFTVDGVKFHIWFQGIKNIPWEKVIRDFTAYTKCQMDKFKEFPVKEYHYLIQIVPFKAYHGVEHHASTVLYLGPTYAVFENLYKELLGVASHELYHTWNVKAIRSSDMYPYDFSKENYSTMGYLCEGVTTYMGDFFLYKSRVFNFDQYALEFNAQLQKHFDNHARFNYSLAESSFDTWLDGYELGAPGRKVSIYTEGCLVAFLMDVRIRKNTDDKRGLDDVMRALYNEYARENKGVSEGDYKAVLKNVSGLEWDEFFADFIYGKKGLEGPITEALDYLGLEMIHSPAVLKSQSQLGVKTMVQDRHPRVYAIYPGSPADMAGIQHQDEVVAINGIALNNDLDAWLHYFDAENKTLTINRAGQMMEFEVPVIQRTFYNQYQIQKLQKTLPPQEKAFLYWSR
jgi:predicted metalloprotease with PDZ domain